MQNGWAAGCPGGTKKAPWENPRRLCPAVWNTKSASQAVLAKRHCLIDLPMVLLYAYGQRLSSCFAWIHGFCCTMPLERHEISGKIMDIATREPVPWIFDNQILQRRKNLGEERFFATAQILTCTVANTPIIINKLIFYCRYFRWQTSSSGL